METLKKEGKLWTYTYANNTKAQIDYVFTNKKWKNRAVNCEAYSSFEGVSSDHWIVTAKIQLSLRKNTTRTTTTIHYELALLNNKDIRDKYVITLKKQIRCITGEDRNTFMRKTNMRISSTQQRNTYQQNKELNLESHGRH